MAGHYNIPLRLNNHIVDDLFEFINITPIRTMEPFKRYQHNGKTFQRLTDRNEAGDTDVMTISPTTLYDDEGEIDTICIAEIHLNDNYINKIYCVL